LGDSSPTGVFAKNEEYDPATDSWRTLTPMRTPRHGAAAATIGDTIYAAGGGVTIGASSSNVNEAFAFSPPPTEPGPQVRKRCRGHLATIVGDAGPDTLFGTPGRDVIVGLKGADRIRGRGGADWICGGKGNDTLRGGGGRDKLFGGLGPDLLLGGAGVDSCLGGLGRDRLRRCER
jgi:Ca2+-binding RTX toxin-like protein